MAKRAFKYREPPIPVDYNRKTWVEDKTLSDSVSLSYILELVKEAGGEVAFTEISAEYDSWSETCPLNLGIQVTESDEEYADRIAAHEKYLADYEKWKLKYADELAEYLQAQEAAKLATKRKNLNADRRALKARMDALEQEKKALARKLKELKDG